MPSLFSFSIVALGMGATLAGALGATAAPTADQAEQLRIIGTMSEQLRARIEKLPMLFPAEQPLGKIEERLLTLNREPVVIEGQRFDGMVVVSPAAKSSFSGRL